MITWTSSAMTRASHTKLRHVAVGLVVLAALFTPLGAARDLRAQTMIPKNSDAVTILIGGFKVLDRSARVVALQTALPEVFRAALLSQRWLDVTRQAPSSLPESADRPPRNPARFRLDATMLEVGDKIRIDIAVIDLVAGESVFRDFTVFTEDSVLATVDTLARRLGQSIQKRIISSEVVKSSLVVAIAGRFAGPSPPGSYAFLETAISSSILAELLQARLKGVEFLDRDEEQGDNAVMDGSITGTYSVVGDVLHIEARVSEPDGAGTSIQVRGSFVELSDILKRVSRGIANIVRGRISDDGRWKEQPLLGSAPGRDEYVAQGDEYVRVHDPYAAILMYTKALEGRPGDADVLLRLAKLYSDQRDYENAIATYRSMTAAGATGAALHNAIGRAYLALRAYDKASGEFELARTDPSTDVRTRVESHKGLGDVHLQQGRVASALKSYLEGALEDPDDADLYRSIGQIYIAQGDTPAAISYFEAGLKVFPERTDFRNDLAELYTRAGLASYDPADRRKQKDALSAFERAIQLQPPDSRVAARAHVFAGALVALSTMGKEDLERGRVHVERAIALDPRNAAAYRTKAAIDNAMGNRSKAVEALKRALELEPLYATYKSIAETYRRMQQYDLAVEAMENALRLDPDRADGYTVLAEVYHLMGRHGEDKDVRRRAISAAKKAISVDSDYEPAHRLLGQIYKDERELDLAIIALRSAIGVDPQSYRAFTELGDVYRLKGEAESAIMYFSSALALAPAEDRSEREWVYRLLGMVYRQKGDLPRAVANLRWAIETRPTEWAYTELGRVYGAQGHHEQAIESFRKAMRVNPRYESAYIELERIYVKRNEHERFVEFLEDVRSRDPEWLWSAVKLGDGYRLRHDYARAVEVLAFAMALDPQRSWTYEVLAATYSDLGDHDKAVYYFSAANKRKPSVVALRGLALAYLAKEEHAQAVSIMRQALDLDGKDEFSYRILANIYSDKGEHDKAAGAVEEGLRVVPDSSFLYASLAETQRLAKNYIAARRAVEQARQRSPDDAGTHATLARIELDVGDYDAAIRSAAKALQSDPSATDVLNVMTKSYSALNRTPEAIAALVGSVNRYPRNVELLNLLGVTYYENVYDYDKAYEALDRALQLQPHNIEIRQNLVEAALAVGRFDRVLDLAGEVLRDWRLDPQGKLSMKFFAISALLFKGNRAGGFAELGEFIRYHKSVAKYRRSWTFKGTTNLVSSSAKLGPTDRALLLRLINILESPKPEADKQVEQLEVSLPDLFRRLQDDGAGVRGGLRDFKSAGSS